MSGGRFDYLQSRLQYDVIEEIKGIIKNNKKEIPVKERCPWNSPDYYEKYPEEKLYSNHSDEIIEKFKEGIAAIEKAYIYIQRIDWYLSGDDGESSFVERLKEELEELNGRIG